MYNGVQTAKCQLHRSTRFIWKIHMMQTMIHNIAVKTAGLKSKPIRLGSYVQMQTFFQWNIFVVHAFGQSMQILIQPGHWTRCRHWYWISRSTYGANPQFTAGTWAKNEKCRHSSVRWDWCHKQSNVCNNSCPMPAWLFGVRLTVIISEKWKFANTSLPVKNNTSFKLAAFQHLCKVSPNATVMVFVPAYYNIEGAMETSLPHTRHSIWNL